MFWRYVASGASALMLAVGVYLADCSYGLAGPPSSEGTLLCLRLGAPPTSSLFSTSGAVILGALAILYLAWAPVWLTKRRQRQDAETAAASIVFNTPRLPNHVVGPLDLEPPVQYQEQQMVELEPNTTEALSVIDSIPEESSASSEEATDGAYLVALGLSRRVDQLEESIQSGSAPPHKAVVRTVKLLKEANDLHNKELLHTHDFKELNTRLLGFFDLTSRVASG